MQALVQPLTGEGPYQTFVLRSWFDEKIPNGSRLVRALKLPELVRCNLFPAAVSIPLARKYQTS